MVLPTCTVDNTHLRAFLVIVGGVLFEVMPAGTWKKLHVTTVVR